MVYSIYFLCAFIINTATLFTGNTPWDANEEIILTYLMVLGLPAGFWGMYITVVEALSGDMSSEAARKRHEEKM